MPRTARRRAAAVLAVALLAASCAGDQETIGTTAPGAVPTTLAPVTTAPEGADGVLRIGAVLPLSGAQEALGPVAAAGAELAVTELEAAGGVLGNDPVLTVADSGSTAPLAARAAEELVASGVDALLVDARGEDLEGVLPVAEAAGVPVCASGPASAGLEADADIAVLFRTTASPALEAGVALVDLDADVETVTVVHAAGAEAAAMADAVERAAVGRSVMRVALPSAVDDAAVTAAVAEVVATTPGAILLAVGPGLGAQLLVALTEAGHGPDQLPVVALGTMASSTLPDRIAEAAPAAPTTTTTTAPTTTTAAEATTTTAPGRDVATIAADGVRGVQLAARAGDQAFVDALGTGGTVGQLGAAAELHDCVLALAVAATSGGGDDAGSLLVSLVDATTGGTACTDAATCLEVAARGDDVDVDGVQGIELDPRGATVTGVVRRWRLRDGALVFTDAVNAPVDLG